MEESESSSKKRILELERDIEDKTSEYESIIKEI